MARPFSVLLKVVQSYSVKREDDLEALNGHKNASG